MNYVSSTSSHLHLCTSTFSPILHLSLFFTFSLKAGGGTAGAPRNATLCGDRARRRREMQARVRFGPVAGNPLRRSCVSTARNAGESAFWPGRGQPSAEIVRVDGAKCRRECVLARSRATLCGDRACRRREMQARVRFGLVAGNPLRRSCVSTARNAGESAFWPGRRQPSAEIVRVERILDLARATLCGDRACRGREMQARVRFGFIRRSPLRRSCVWKARHASGISEWPVCSTNVVGERAFRSWTQKWPVCSANVVGERAFSDLDSEVASLEYKCSTGKSFSERDSEVVASLSCKCSTGKSFLEMGSEVWGAG